jgi:[ribosomal protein S18]-alanine N-acetyltransferase
MIRPAVEIRALEREEVELVDRHLPLDRLDQPGGEWLVAWDGAVPVGHAHVDWRSEPPEVQNVFVTETHRRRGVATSLSSAAEELVRARGHTSIALDVDVANDAARALYAKLGYSELGSPPRRACGTILLRGKPFTYDVVLVDLVKRLDEPVDSATARSSSS